MNVKTKSEVVEVKLYINARPPWDHKPEEMARGYGLSIDTVDCSCVGGYVHIGAVTTSVQVPAGVDVLAGMVTSLRKKQQKIRAESEVKCNAIEAHIQSMMCIEHKPEEQA